MFSIAIKFRRRFTVAVFDPNDSLGFHCKLTYKYFSSALEKRLARDGVSQVQFVALAYLIVFGELSQSELADHLSITPASMARLVDRLSRDGWVERRAHPEDRRIKRIVLTPNAREVWDDLSQHARAVLDHAYSGVSEEELALVKDVMRRCRENLTGPQRS
jgi:DNA-binding MarR family transcriptional regulator